MGSGRTTFILIVLGLLGSIYAQEQCSITVEENGQETNSCGSNYDCISGQCIHKGLFPMSSLELTGTALIMLVTGLSNAAGSGGSTLTTLFLLMFFDYTENKAVMIAYALVFGGSLGNFMNTGFGKNPRTDKPYINYDVILVSMPMMLLGTSIGVVLNRMVAPFCITIGLVIVMYLSVGKVYRKAVKEYKEESGRDEKMLTTEKSEDESPTKSFHGRFESIQDDEDLLVNPEWQKILKEEHSAIPKKKMNIIISLLVTSMILAVLKGSQKVDSILGLKYCSQEYWEMFALGILVCLIFACFNRRFVRKINMIKKACKINHEPGEFNITDVSIKKLGKASAIAGVLAGLLGMGGGTVMSPVLLSMDASIENVVATSGFFVVQTSFMTLFQSALYGDVSILELIFFLAVSFLGSYGISFVLKALIQKVKRPSIALFILVAFFVIGIVAMPAFEIWKSFSDFMEMITFNSVC